MNSQISYKEQLAEVKREVWLRRGVYPKWVASGTLDPASAERQLNVMLAVQATLEKLAEAEELAKQPRLL